MKLLGKFRFGFVIVAALVLAGELGLRGGHPLPPQRHSPERRQANMTMLRFQDALASERWQEALALCSARVQAKAADSPSPKQFFNDTMPIEHVLAQDFGCWTCSEKFYGLFVTISDWNVTPPINWYWGIDSKPGGWEVDYPPTKLDEYVVKKKAAFQARDDRIKEIRRALEPKAQEVVTRLTAVSDRFVVGSPMLFRIEMTNSGPTSVHYMDYGVKFAGLMVQDDQHREIPHGGTGAQIGVHNAELQPRASVVLADNIDLNKHLAITKPGRYVVQFDGRTLDIGQPMPSLSPPSRFGEDLSLFPFDFLSATNKFPSNIIQIDVLP